MDRASRFFYYYFYLFLFYLIKFQILSHCTRQSNEFEVSLKLIDKKLYNSCYNGLGFLWQLGDPVV